MMQGKLDHENSYPWRSIQYWNLMMTMPSLTEFILIMIGSFKQSDEEIGKAQLAMAVLLLSQCTMISTDGTMIRGMKCINTVK